ncbi:hypothetical protein DFQ09_104258 [Winogradskyella pacifica]|uniref:Uncharacterized protein n=1 Tax=Winogradskyella pacifica TaxID=664642 RepID=A0A3D9MZD7_9FLAO|nr:hypothetical protein [Winogradskyella pacifica]REE24487.1 hypothetical protein DFQ09_104258 [Winogradskyella pacifica]
MNPFLILFLIICIPFYIWIVSFLNASFFIPSFEDHEAKDFLEAHGYEFVKCEEVKNDGNHKLEEHFLNSLYSLKTHYQLTALSIADGSEKKFRLILKKTYVPLNSKRVLHYFEE